MRATRKWKPLLILVWAAFGLVAVFSFVDLLSREPGSLTSLPDVINSISLYAFFIISAGIGALIISNQPRNAIGWLLMFYPIASVLSVFISILQLPSASGAGQPSTITLVLLWFESWSWWLLMGPIFLISLLFPTGKLLSPAWRWVIAELLVCFLVFLFLVTFSSHITDINNSQIEYTNPIGWLSLESFNVILTLLQILLSLIAISSVASIFVRYRRAAYMERLQIKWLLYAFGIFLVVYLSNMILNLSDSKWASLLFNLSLIGIAAAIGAAILRYRLFDIEVIIRRTLVYGSLTVLLSALYFVLVIVLQRLWIFFSGQESPVALVVSTVAIVLLFNLLRQRVQLFIDRRFFRSQYNADRLLMEFSQTARDEVDLYLLVERLQVITQESVNPQTISFWIQEMED